VPYSVDQSLISVYDVDWVVLWPLSTVLGDNPLKNAAKKIFSLSVSLTLIFSFVACGGGGGGSGENAVNIEGTLSSASATSRLLTAGDGGVSGVEVSALGDSTVTDDLGNFNLTTDGTVFSGGPVEFTLQGSGVDGTAAFSDVAGGPGATAFIDLAVQDDGSIAGISSDSDGNVLSEITSTTALGCTQTSTFSDGGGGALWKPVSESTGTVVVLMPSSYQSASVQVLDANGNEVASVIRTGCCDHNGNRMHWWWSRSAASLAGESLPLTVKFDLGNGTVDCRTVPDPRQRYD